MIKIAEDYTLTPGPRKITQGKYSGEDFRESILLPKYKEARDRNEKLVVDFDGTYGYFDSFLEESFGGLARKFSDNTIYKNFIFISKENPTVIEKVIDYIKNALNR